MNLPSRGLRPSATTIRNTGKFLVPTRFILILTAIINRDQYGLTCHILQGFAQKSVKRSLGGVGLQALFSPYLYPKTITTASCARLRMSACFREPDWVLSFPSSSWIGFKNSR